MSDGSKPRQLVERPNRRDVNVVAVAVRADGSSETVRIRNMSYEGCMLEADAVFSVGEKLTLALPRMGEIRTQVRWTAADGRTGLRFLAEEIVADEPHDRIGL
jgi:hypothetical protein